MGLFQKINKGLKKTRDSMSGAIDNVLGAFSSIDDELYEELEEALVMGDVGVSTAGEIISRLRERVRKKAVSNPAKVRVLIQEIVAEMLAGGEALELETIPSVILVIGVNGVGKTTTIGKLAARLKAEGKKVILGAADTFRAAAIEQLEEWANRAGVEMIKHREGADPAAVVFDTISAGVARDADVIIIDTAGRLHNKKNLMEELAKIYRVIDRELPYSDRESLLVLDATTGQNAVNQAREFKNVAEITGIILTKLDGTARGGVVLSIKNDLQVPVKYIGVGEQIDDLQPFSPQAFAQGLFDAVPEDFDEAAMQERLGLAGEEEAQDEAETQTTGAVEYEAGLEMDGLLLTRDERKESENASGEPAQAIEERPAPVFFDGDGDKEDESALQAEEAQPDELDDTVTSQPEGPKERKKRFGFFNRNT